jgi:hypothetical protein
MIRTENMRNRIGGDAVRIGALKGRAATFT